MDVLDIAVARLVTSKGSTTFPDVGFPSPFKSAHFGKYSDERLEGLSHDWAMWASTLSPELHGLPGSLGIELGESAATEVITLVVMNSPYAQVHVLPRIPVVCVCVCVRMFSDVLCIGRVAFITLNLGALRLETRSIALNSCEVGPLMF